jgi:hypothetical protein
VFKGFDGQLPEEYELALREVNHERCFVPDVGYDIDVYFSTARAITSDVVCFLNSYSVILGDEWLLKLYRALARDGVGLAGATGSWQSLLASYRPIPDSIRPRRAAWQEVLLQRVPQIRSIRRLLRRMTLGRHFNPFPNPHVRTNAFILRRSVALHIEVAPIGKKHDAYRFESGRQGMTAQIRALNKRCVIVDRKGDVYEIDEWYRSNTFWRATQQHLLVSDNQTRMFDRLPRDGRRYLSYLAWGPKADPS